MESPAVVAKALQEARDSAARFADLLFACVALANGANEVITFDKSFGRQPKVRRLT